MNTFTQQEILIAITTVLLTILSYFLKRFANSVFTIEERLGDMSARMAVVEDRLKIMPRRRSTDPKD